MVVLQPSWLAKVMATVVTVALPNTTMVPGQLHRADLEAVWKDYSADTRPALLKLLHAYEVAFPARDRDDNFLDFSVVPAMLRGETQPDSVEKLLKSEAAGEQVRHHHHHAVVCLSCISHQVHSLTTDCLP